MIVSGLIADFKGNKFGKTLDLIPICTNIHRLHAYCSTCAKDKKCSIAIYSKKIVKCKKNIDIGGAEKYIPVCRQHYFEVDPLNNLDNVKNKINKNKNKIEKELIINDENKIIINDEKELIINDGKELIINDGKELIINDGKKIIIDNEHKLITKIEKDYDQNIIETNIST